MFLFTVSLYEFKLCIRAIVYVFGGVMSGILRFRECKKCGGNALVATNGNRMQVFCVRCGTVYYQKRILVEKMHAVQYV